MKNRILFSMLVIALAAAMVGGATMAWFSDAAKTDPVDLQAGTLMIDLDNPTLTGTYNVNLDRLNPGDCVEWEFDVDNVGTKSANWLLYMCWRDTIGRDNDQLPAGQQELLRDREGFGTNGLSEVVQLTIKVDDGKPVHDGAIDGAPLVIDELNDYAFDGGSEPRTVTVKACLPGKKTDNKYQGARLDLYFGVKAWQTTNNAPAIDPETIGCEFDNEKDPTPVVVTAFDLDANVYGTQELQIGGEITNLQGENGPVPIGTKIDVVFTLKTGDPYGNATIWPSVTKTLEYIEFNNGDTGLWFGAGNLVDIPRATWGAGFAFAVEAKIGDITRTINYNLSS